MCNRMIWRSRVKRPCPCWWDRQVANMPWRQRPHSELLRNVTTSCRWEKWFERVSGSSWVLVVARWKWTSGKCRSTWNETVCVWKLMFWSVHRDLDTWRREQLSRMSSWMVWTSKSPMHRRVLAQQWNHQLKQERHLHLVLKTWSNLKELDSKLRELGAPVYGTKNVLFRRLCECEQIAAKEEDEYLEMRRKELATEPVTPKILHVWSSSCPGDPAPQRQCAWLQSTTPRKRKVKGSRKCRKMKGMKRREVR